MTGPIFEITKAAHFDAAHYLPTGADDPRYRQMHGHSFRVEATVRGPAVGQPGWVADLGALDRALKLVAEGLDHGLLNDKAGLESPTLENLCLYFARALGGEFPGLCRVTLSRPTVGESCTLRI